MSKYEYRCRKCGCEYEITEQIAEHERHPKPSCPKCKSHSVEQVPAVFQAKTDKKT